MATARKATRFTGVQARESSIRRHNGRPDVCYTIDYRDPATGSRIRRDVGWLSEGITAQLAAKIRQEAIQAGRDLTAQPGGEVIPAPPAMSLDDAYQRYRRDWLLAHGKRTQMEDTLVRCHLQELLPLPLDQITPYVLDQLMARMRGQGRSPQTIRHAVSLIRRVMRRMVAWELYNGPLPFRQVNMPRPDNARQRYLTPSEAHRLLAELHTRSRQTWLMALISLHCGLRFSEVARLRYGDVDQRTRTLYIGQSKSGRARHAVMTPDVARALADLPRMSRMSLLFPARDGGIMKAASETFPRAVEALGLNRTDPENPASPPIKDRRQRVVFHTLRHTYASWLALAGEHELSLSELLGHTSTAMTRRYAHLMDDARRKTADALMHIFHDSSPDAD